MSSVKSVLRKFVKLTGWVRSNWGELTLLKQPIGSRVMVIAPHPDDETFGCGGAIALHRQLGHPVDIVFLTNGERGIAGKKPDEVSSIRKAEAIRATQIIGVEAAALHFLQLPDGTLNSN